MASDDDVAGPYRRVTAVVVPPPLCRRCVRLLSRCVRDVPGVLTLRVDPVSGEVRVLGDVAPEHLVAALAAAGWRPAHGAGR
jgi:copper chaperone CopZ